MAKIHRPPISLARVAALMKDPSRKGNIAVVVGTVTDDQRVFKIPKLTVSFVRIDNLRCLSSAGSLFQTMEFLCRSAPSA